MTRFNFLKYKIILFFFLLSNILLPAHIQAGGDPYILEAGPTPSISELAVSNSQDMLLAYFSLENGFTPEVLDSLRSGVSIKYIFDVELLIDRLFKRKRIVRKTVTRVVSFDSLKGEYRVSFGPQIPRIVSVRNLEEASKEAFQINDVAIMPLARLVRGKMYVLRVRASAEQASSTLPFERLMRIFPKWGFETDWREIRFTY